MSVFSEIAVFSGNSHEWLSNTEIDTKIDIKPSEQTT